MDDPSIRFSDRGRYVVRWLGRYSLGPETCQNLATSVPDHWAMPIAVLARSCATVWLALAEQLEQRPSGDDHARSAV
jgi:hypothetical protein